MRDNRESTLISAKASAEGEVLADRLPKVLASRLRAARNAAGLSQGAAAKAMADRGFSWRQTTVAKSEAADRPVLFAEVAALSQIYKREIEYFLYPGTELDSLMDEAAAEMASIQNSLMHAEQQVVALRHSVDLYERTLGIASAIRRFRNSGDSGPLLEDLRELLARWGQRCLTVYDVYESIEVSRAQLEAVDAEALHAAAKIERDWIARFPAKDLIAKEIVEGVRPFLAGERVPESVPNFLRTTNAWEAFATPLLADLVIAAVNSQIE
jgi:transcriptional regulator with XRE-family HTH domain